MAAIHQLPGAAKRPVVNPKPATFTIPSDEELQAIYDKQPSYEELRAMSGLEWTIHSLASYLHLAKTTRAQLEALQAAGYGERERYSVAK